MARAISGKNGKAELEDYTPSAVLFSDGAGEGNAGEVDGLMPLLNAIKASSDERTLAAIQACVAHTSGHLGELYNPDAPKPPEAASHRLTLGRLRGPAS